MVMFFELTNSLATFQAFMNHILQDLINAGHMIVYMDDILVFTNMIEEHNVRFMLQPEVKTDVGVVGNQ